MHCASCVSSIEGALRSLPGVADASVNLATERASVDYDPCDTDVAQLIAAVNSVGYSAFELATESRHGRETDDREGLAEHKLRLLTAKFVFAAIIGAALLVLSFVWSPFGERTTMWVMLALATPVQFWSGWQFYAGAWNVARHRSADMNTLIAVGTERRLPLQPGRHGRPAGIRARGAAARRLLRHRRRDHRPDPARPPPGSEGQGRHHRGDQEADRASATNREDRARRRGARGVGG